MQNGGFDLSEISALVTGFIQALLAALVSLIVGLFL